MDVEKVNLVFDAFKAYQFEKAEKLISELEDAKLKREIRQLRELLIYAGQKDSTHFKSVQSSLEEHDELRQFVQLLGKGYYQLFYQKVKGNAFRYFFDAHDLALKMNNSTLIKAALLGLLEYYHFEIAQNSTVYQEYLAEYKNLKPDLVDKTWIGIYEAIFVSKSLEGLKTEYYSKVNDLIGLKKEISPLSLLIPRIDFEIALKHEFENNFEEAQKLYLTAIDKSGTYPFLRDIRFFSYLHLSQIDNKKQVFTGALEYLKSAKVHVDLADTLRSNYYINLYSSYSHNGLKNNDTAYSLLKKAYIAEYTLDHRKNSLEVNRLNVVLSTQKKELENIQLKQNKTWLTGALIILGLLLLLSYLGYTNIKKKKQLVENEKELQSQKLEKLLKDQELLGIDAMIQGQEKERQRIANDLHDNLGSLLATLKLHFQNLKVRKTRLKEEEDKLLDKTDDLIEEAYQKVRSIAHARNAGVHAQDGLLPAVKNFAAKVSSANRLEIEVIDHGMDERLDNSLEITIFRIVQELITNIIKHASAKEATIHLTQHADLINIMVEDDGVGFKETEKSNTSGMGLHSIKKRVENLKGTLTIESVLEKGTTIIIDIPIL